MIKLSPSFLFGLIAKLNDFIKISFIYIELVFEYDSLY